MFTVPEGSAANEVLESRWKALSAALDALTAASKLPSADNLAKIHLARGDVELLRFQLGQPPAAAYDVASKNAAVLARNAEKFYRGAGALARAAGQASEEEEARVKEALAAALGNDAQPIKDVVRMQGERAKAVLDEAVDDGVMSIEQLVAMGIAS